MITRLSIDMFVREVLLEDSDSALEAAKRQYRVCSGALGMSPMQIYVSAEAEPPTEERKHLLELAKDETMKFMNNGHYTIEGLKALEGTDLIKDKQFILQALSDVEKIYKSAIKHFILRCLPKELREDKELVLQIISKGFDIYEGLSKELQTDKDVLIEIIKIDRLYRNAFKDLPLELRTDKDILIALLHQYGVTAWYSFSYELQNNPSNISPEVIEKYKQILLRDLKSGSLPRNWEKKNIPLQLQKDPDIIAAIQQAHR